MHLVPLVLLADLSGVLWLLDSEQLEQIWGWGDT